MRSVCFYNTQKDGIMTDGARIRIARTKAGLTMREAAERIGRTKQSWEQWEQGKRHPRMDTMREIAGALGMTVVELLCVGEKAEAVSAE